MKMEYSYPTQLTIEYSNDTEYRHCLRKLFKMKPSLSVDVNCTKILPYLYLGGYEVTTDKQMMQNTLKITHIVNVTVESECHFEDDFKYAHIKLRKYNA